MHSHIGMAAAAAAASTHSNFPNSHHASPFQNSFMNIDHAPRLDPSFGRPLHQTTMRSDFMDSRASTIHGRMCDRQSPSGSGPIISEEMISLLLRMYLNIKQLRLHKPLLPQELLREKLRMGDHLISERLRGFYHHDGVYIGNDTVIHFQGPHSSGKCSNPCGKCGYVPPKKGTVVETCLDCFNDGHSFRVREYGIKVSKDTIPDWILEKLNVSGVIYTCRKGDIYIGKWTHRNTVIHLIWMESGSASSYSSCENYSFSPETGRLETSLKSFLQGGLLYINELGLHVARGDDDGDRWYFCQDKPIVSVFRKLCGESIDKVYEVWDSITSERSGFKKLWEQLIAPSFIIYENEQIQVCELSSTKSPDLIVSKARKYLKHGFNRYNLLFNNCEHFATACKTDTRRSVQTENRTLIATDKRIQRFLDTCDPPTNSKPMETLMNLHLPVDA